MIADGDAATVDAFLGGQVEAVQPASRAHRSGLDAVLLAAAIDADFSGTLFDLGSGAGVAGFCVAARCTAAYAVLVDRDAVALGHARSALTRPANHRFAARVALVEANIAAPETMRAAAGLNRASADVVIMNPPYRTDASGTRSPHTERATAHVLAEDGLDPWLRAAASLLRAGGDVAIIFPASGLDELLAAMAGRFGGAAILPVHPRADLPAHRVIVQARKGSRAPLQLLPGLVLHASVGNGYLVEADRILREGASLADVHAGWAKR